MKKLPKHLANRRHIQKRYNEELHDLIERPEWSETCQYYCARVPREARDSLIDFLADKEIHTSVHFKPLHNYGILIQNRDYPVADNEWLKLITFPCFNAMTDDDFDYVIYWVNRYFEEEYIMSTK
jgi:perosamine synthetase